VAYADSVLRASGLRVGRYTSPHLIHVSERIAVGRRAISDRALDREVARVQRGGGSGGRRGRPARRAHVLSKCSPRPGSCTFQRARVDVAVLEVGMGARLDATNVVEPLCSAIVTVDRDHEAYLGTTLAAIAREKAGVLRRGRTTVLGPMAAPGPRRDREGRRARSARGS
jgi:folylpolyglutamate synthase/dihydrofolate synthase